jgi:hypothetical protein
VKALVTHFPHGSLEPEIQRTSLDQIRRDQCLKMHAMSGISLGMMAAAIPPGSTNDSSGERFSVLTDGLLTGQPAGEGKGVGFLLGVTVSMKQGVAVKMKQGVTVNMKQGV